MTQLSAIPSDLVPVQPEVPDDLVPVQPEVPNDLVPVEQTKPIGTITPSAELSRAKAQQGPMADPRTQEDRISDEFGRLKSARQNERQLMEDQARRFRAVGAPPSDPFGPGIDVDNPELAFDPDAPRGLTGVAPDVPSPESPSYQFANADLPGREQVIQKRLIDRRAEALSAGDKQMVEAIDQLIRQSKAITESLQPMPQPAEPDDPTFTAGSNPIDIQVAKARRALEFSSGLERGAVKTGVFLRNLPGNIKATITGDEDDALWQEARRRVFMEDAGLVTPQVNTPTARTGELIGELSTRLAADISLARFVGVPVASGRVASAVDQALLARGMPALGKVLGTAAGGLSSIVEFSAFSSALEATQTGDASEVLRAAVDAPTRVAANFGSAVGKLVSLQGGWTFEELFDTALIVYSGVKGISAGRAEIQRIRTILGEVRHHFGDQGVAAFRAAAESRGFKGVVKAADDLLKKEPSRPEPAKLPPPEKPDVQPRPTQAEPVAQTVEPAAVQTRPPAQAQEAPARPVAQAQAVEPTQPLPAQSVSEGQGRSVAGAEPTAGDAADAWRLTRQEYVQRQMPTKAPVSGPSEAISSNQWAISVQNALANGERPTVEKVLEADQIIGPGKSVYPDAILNAYPQLKQQTTKSTQPPAPTAPAQPFTKGQRVNVDRGNGPEPGTVIGDVGGKVGVRLDDHGPTHVDRSKVTLQEQPDVVETQPGQAVQEGTQGAAEPAATGVGRFAKGDRVSYLGAQGTITKVSKSGQITFRSDKGRTQIVKNPSGLIPLKKPPTQEQPDAQIIQRTQEQVRQEEGGEDIRREGQVEQGAQPKGKEPKAQEVEPDVGGKIDTESRVEGSDLFREEGGSVRLSTIKNAAAAPVRMIAETANVISGQMINPIRTTSAGRGLSIGLDDVASKSATLLGRIENKAHDAFKGLSGGDMRWLQRVDENGVGNMQRLLEDTVSGEQLAPPNKRLANWVKAYRTMMDMTGDEAIRVGVQAIRRDGKPGPFTKAQAGRMLRFMTPDAMTALWYESGPLYNAMIEWLMKFNPGMKRPQVADILREYVGRESVRRIGSLENVRLLPNFPTSVQLPGGKWVNVLETDPKLVITNAANWQAKRIYFIERFGQALPKQKVTGVKEGKEGEKLVFLRTEKTPTLVDRLRARHLKEGGDVDQFDAVLAVFHHRPFGEVISNPRNFWKRTLRVADSLISASQISSAVLVNIPQTVMAISTVGARNWAKGVWRSLFHPKTTVAQLAAMGAMHRSTMEWVVRQGHVPEDMARIIGQLFSWATGLHWLSQFNNMVAGEAARAMVAGYRNYGTQRADAGVLRDLRLTPAEIKAVKSGRISPEIENKIVQNAVKVTQFILEDPHRKSLMQNIPLANAMIAYNSYFVGTAKQSVRHTKNIFDAAGAGSEIRFSRAVYRWLVYVAGMVTAGVLSRMLLETSKGRNPVPQDAKGFRELMVSATFESQILGPVQRALDASRFGGSSGPDYLVSVLPKVKFISDVIVEGLMGQGGEFENFPMMERIWRKLRKNVSGWNRLAQFVDNMILYDGQDDYSLIRRRVWQWEKDQGRPRKGSGPINPDTWPIRLAVRGRRWDQAEKLIEESDVKRDKLRSSLTTVRPMNLSKERIKAFLATLEPELRDKAQKIQGEYEKEIRRLLKKAKR